MGGAVLKYLPDIDLYEDDAGNRFIKNEFMPETPVFITVAGNVWEASYKGIQHRCVFSVLPDALRDDAKAYLRHKLKSNSPAYLSKFHQANRSFARLLPTDVRRYEDVTIDDWLEIWEETPSDYRSVYREFYTWLSMRSDSEPFHQLAAELRLWKARNNTRSLRRVLDWDPKYGAFTSDESEVLLRLLQSSPRVDDARGHAIRLFGWILFETLKRPSQVLGMRATALKTISNNGIEEFFLEIPKAKAQSAEDAGYWRITNELADEINRFSRRSEIARLQQSHDRLLVWPNGGLGEHGEISSLTAGQGLFAWVNAQGLLSPRTGRPMHVRPYRIRNTGGTRLAMQGFSIDEIMDVLEHDSRYSCQAYIDAVGADLIPAIEKADRKLGSLFVNLANLFFNGKVVDKLDADKGIYVPDFSHGPALVGSCGRNVSVEGRCAHHPFHRCYDGCPQFMAWRDGDHNRALKYAESELLRWNESDGHKERNKNIKDFERLYSAIVEVKRQIDLEGG